MLDTTEIDAKDDFVEQFGLVMQAEGFPRIAGRLLGLFVLEGGPLGSADLAERLSVSRGSVSTNTRLLEELGAIERVALPGARGDFFRLADNPYIRISERKAVRAQRTAVAIGQHRDRLGPEEGDAKARMADLAAFFEAIAQACSDANVRLREGRG